MSPLDDPITRAQRQLLSRSRALEAAAAMNDGTEVPESVSAAYREASAILADAGRKVQPTDLD